MMNDRPPRCPASPATPPPTRLRLPSSLITDLRYATRQLRKNPGFSALTVTILAIGIGANSALFTVVDHLLFSPLPFPDPQELVYVDCHIRDLVTGISGPDYLDWRDQNDVFQELTAVEPDVRLNLTGTDEPLAVQAMRVTPNFLSTLGVQPAHGRSFLPRDAVANTPHVAIVSHDLWQSRFGGDSNLVERSITLDGIPHTVVGIGPAPLGFIRELAEVMVPLREADLAQERRRGTQNLIAIGRLKAGVTLAQAQANLDVIVQRLATLYADSNRGKRVELVPLHTFLVRDIRLAFLALYAGVSSLLLIACVNVASLLLAKSGSRTREMAVRLAVGASRGRIVRQVLTESATLALLGGASGIALALLVMQSLIAAIPANRLGLELSEFLAIDSTVLVWTLGVSVVVGIAFGIAPAATASRTSLGEALKEGGQSASEGTARQRGLRALMVAEVALALALLVGAGLVTRSYLNLQAAAFGFNADGIVLVELELPDAPGYRQNWQRVAVLERVLEQMRAVPGVKAAAGGCQSPLQGGAHNGFAILDRPSPGGVRHFACFRQVTPGFFRVLDIPLRAGRYPTDSDGRSGQLVVVVNEVFAERFFPGENPIGQHIIINKSEYQEIIGVVGNVKSTAQTLSPEVYPPIMYEPLHQFSWRSFALLARVERAPDAITQPIRDAIRTILPDVPLSRVVPLQAAHRASLSIQSFSALLFVAMAAVAVVLGAMGVYGVTAYVVSRRTHEIGVRKALGATTDQVIHLVVRQSMVSVLVGVLIGLGITAALTTLLRSVLYDLSPFDPVTFVGMAVFLFLVSLVACYYPARRAAQVDPMTALRVE